MKNMFKRPLALFALALLLVSMIYFPPKAEAENLFYGDYTDVAAIKDYGSCPSMQGLAVGSQMLYTIKIKTDNTQAFISMTDKDTGETTKLYNSDNGSYYYTDMDHANDMDVWGIDGSSHLFITTTKTGNGSVVRYKRSGSNLTKVGSYNITLDGSNTWCSGMSITSVADGKINFIFKSAMNLYTASIDVNATSGAIVLNPLCVMNRSRVYIKGEYLDLSGWTTQGMGYYKDTLFLPLSGDDSQLNRSVILIFDLRKATGTIYPTEALVFRVTSGAYSALFEIESCDISSSDGKLYFNANRRKTDSDTNHDAVSVFDGYVFEQLPEDAPTSKPQTYTVRYDANGGTGTMADTTVIYGTSTKLTANAFTRNGYSFAGWHAYRTTQDLWYYTDTSGNEGWYKLGAQPSGMTLHTYKDQVGVAKTSSIDGDVVIMYAQWTPLANTYTIKYHANGGTGTMEDTTVVYGYSTPLRANTFTREGYTFVGWTAHRTSQNQWYYTNGSSSAWYTEGSQPSGYSKTIYKDQANVAATTAVANDVCNFYAQWEANPYTVEFKDANGTVLSSATYAYGDTVTVPADPSKDYDSTNHYTFAGWSPAVTTVTGSTTYTATYTATPHSYTSKVIVEPVCDISGIKMHYCTCGYSYREDLLPLGHYYTTSDTAPDCTNGGYTTYTCIRCGDDYTGNEVPALGHTAQVVPGYAATCTTTGLTDGSKCAVCGITLTAPEIIPVLDHSYNAVTTAPTCTDGGYTTYTCSACGDTYVADYVNATGHTEEVVPGYAATCTATGLTDGSKCAVCGETLVAQQVIPASKHSYTAVVTAPTCTMDGYTTYTCTCGDSYKDDIVTAAGHNYESAVTTQPGCETMGVTTFTCTTCGDAYTEALEATGHSYEATVTAPTCTDAGYTTYACACGSSYVSAYVDALGHKAETVPGYAADCENTGLTDGNKCTVCGETLTAQEVIPATGHTEETVPGTAADCTNTGLTDGSKCAVCGETLTAQEVIPATGHTEETVPGTAADCTNTGLTDGVKCAVCGETLTAQETIPATGHNFENGSCTNCGEADPDATVPSVIPTITMRYPSLSFEDVIIMNVYYLASDLQDVVEMGLITNTVKPDVVSIENADAVIPGYGVEGDFYFSSTEGIAPKDIGDTIYFAVYAKLADGTVVYTKMIGYSPKTYAVNQLTTGSAEMRPLVAAMLNYGAAAQTYFNYKTDALVNATMTDEQKAMAEAYRADMIASVTQASGAKLGTFINDKTYTQRYPTISFEGAFCINYYFQPSLAVVGDVTMYVWSLEDYEAAEVLTKENATKAIKMELTESGEYMAVVDGIAAKDLDKAAYVSFVYNDGTTEHCGGVIAYTIGMYCKSQASGTGALSELAKACAVYGYYAKQLFN